MGNTCGGLSRKKPCRRPTLSSQRRPVTVDREADTEFLDEESTVSQDRTTASRPHLITFYYPPDTPAEISQKLPTERQYKNVNQTILIGRGLDADVMLNEEHIPRHFVHVLCRCDRNMEPKWYLRNLSEKKVVSVFFNGLKTCIRFGDETELQDGCELNLDVLTLFMKIEDGDLGNKQVYEVRVCPTENDSSNSSSATSSWNRKASDRSTTTYNSVAAPALERGRQGSRGAKGWDQRSLQYQYTEHGHFADAGPVVQHLVHYYHNMPPPGSPVTTCCLHHHPYGCPQQHHQHCHTCHQPGQGYPDRKGSNQETHVQTLQNPPSSTNIIGMGYLPREEIGPVTTASPVMTQSPLAAGQNFQPLCSPPYARKDSSQRQGHMINGQQMYQATDLASRSRYALPELVGMHPNNTILYGPPAIHQQHMFPTHSLVHQQSCGHYPGHQPTMPVQPVFMNLLRRSQSMFTRQRQRPEQRQRRSSCDGIGVQLTPQLVAQPESAQIDLATQHGFSETDITSLILHETAHKAYHTPSRNAMPHCTQIDSLKFVRPAREAESPSASTVSTSVDMAHRTVASWEAVDGAKIHTPSACADLATNSRYPVESISDMLLPSTEFTSSSSASGDERSWANTSQQLLCSFRQPQEDDERQPGGKHVHL